MYWFSPEDLGLQEVKKCPFCFPITTQSEFFFCAILVGIKLTITWRSRPHASLVLKSLLFSMSQLVQHSLRQRNSSSPLPKLVISSCLRHLLEQIEYTHPHACSNCALVLLSSFSEECFVQNANRWLSILFIYEQKAIWVIPTSSRATKFLNNNSQVAHTTYPENVIDMRAVCSHLIRFGGN